MGPRNRIDALKKKQNLLPLLGIRPRFLGSPDRYIISTPTELFLSLPKSKWVLDNVANISSKFQCWSLSPNELNAHVDRRRTAGQSNRTRAPIAVSCIVPTSSNIMVHIRLFICMNIKFQISKQVVTPRNNVIYHTGKSESTHDLQF